MKRHRWIMIMVAFMACLIGADGLMSEERKCLPRSGFFFEYGSNQHFAGLFRIILQPPDLRDVGAVQRHLILSEVWAGTVSIEIANRIGRLCTAIITPFAFPDMRAFLAVNRAAGRGNREKLTC